MGNIRANLNHLVETTISCWASIWEHHSSGTRGKLNSTTVRCRQGCFQNKISSRAKGDRVSQPNLRLLITYKAIVRKRATGPIAKLMAIIWPTILARSHAGTSRLAKTINQLPQFGYFFLGHKVLDIYPYFLEFVPWVLLINPLELRADISAFVKWW